jgi:hypothetical protein
VKLLRRGCGESALPDRTLTGLISMTHPHARR